MPNGESFDYTANVVKAQRFSSDEIFEKRLLILLPYYLMRYEKALGEIESDDARTTELVAECSDLRTSLEQATLAKGEPLLYEQLTELIIKVSDYMLKAHEVLRKKVRRTMGGEVLELMRDRAERLEREALEQGRKEGIERGLEQGRKEAISDLSAKLVQLGTPQNVIDEAIAALEE